MASNIAMMIQSTSLICSSMSFSFHLIVTPVGGLHPGIGFGGGGTTAPGIVHLTGAPFLSGQESSSVPEVGSLYAVDTSTQITSPALSPSVGFAALAFTITLSVHVVAPFRVSPR